MRNKAIAEGGRKVQKIFLNKMGHKKKKNITPTLWRRHCISIDLNEQLRQWYFKDNLSEALWKAKVSYDLFILNPSAANSIQIRLSQTFSSFARPPLLLTGFSLFTADCFVYQCTKAIWLWHRRHPELWAQRAYLTFLALRSLPA